MLTRSQKDQLIGEIKSDIERSGALFVTNLIGISSNDAVAVRKSVREVDGKVVITRNTLFRLAAQGTKAESVLSDLKGPHAVAFAFEDAAAVAKCLKNAGKEHELITLKGGLLGEEVLDEAKVKALADLPSRDEMLGTLLATFNAPISALARVLNAVKEKKEEGGEATTEEAVAES